MSEVWWVVMDTLKWTRVPFRPPSWSCPESTRTSTIRHLKPCSKDVEVVLLLLQVALCPFSS